MPLRSSFTELEADALTELINISVSSAATSLSRILKQGVVLSVPAFSIVAAAEVLDLLLPSRVSDLVAVTQDFSGAFDGKAILIFPEEDSRALAALLGEALGLAEHQALLWADALTETGNIVLQSCLSSLANLLLKQIKIEQPHLIEAGVANLVQNSNGTVLFIYIDFDVRGRRIKGYLALLLDLHSLEQLHGLVADFIERTV